MIKAKRTRNPVIQYEVASGLAGLAVIKSSKNKEKRNRNSQILLFRYGRDDRIRTCGPLVPKPDALPSCATSRFICPQSRTPIALYWIMKKSQAVLTKTQILKSQATARLFNRDKIVGD